MAGPTEIRKIAGVNVEVEIVLGKPKATLKGMRAFFGLSGGPKPSELTSAEIMNCKRDANIDPPDNKLRDWDQLAFGVGNGTLTY